MGDLATRLRDLQSWAAQIVPKLEKLANVCERATEEQRCTLEKSLEALQQYRSVFDETVESIESEVKASEPAQMESLKSSAHQWPLELEEYRRYGRQLIMPEIGLKGQQRLKSASILVVGAGGLGCPAAAYLAGAGVGQIGLVDGDTVEESNLHRQIMHKTSFVGKPKVDSLAWSLKEINPLLDYRTYAEHLSIENSQNIFSGYDLILDCTDHPTSRYLISDTAILLQKPLVSASALRTEGQLIVLNHPAAASGETNGGPCYRCIFPRPPPPESVLSCGEGGILGPVVGVMGVLQALEAIKLTLSDISDLDSVEATPTPSMLMFSSFSAQQFRKIKLRSRRPDCKVCSPSAVINKEYLDSGSMDYVRFCSAVEPPNILQREERVSALEHSGQRKESALLLVDVRDKTQFELCSMPGSINAPINEVQGWKTAAEAMKALPGLATSRSVHVICRMGNDSQVAVRKLKALRLDEEGARYIGDIRGGWEAWQREVDPNWPLY